MTWLKLTGSTSTWTKCFKICTQLKLLDKMSPVAEFLLEPQGFKLQLKNKQVTYLFNILVKPSAFGLELLQVPKCRFAIGLTNIGKYLALFEKECWLNLNFNQGNVTEVQLGSKTVHGQPIVFNAQVLQSDFKRVKLTTNFETISSNMNGKVLLGYLNALEGSGLVRMVYDGTNARLEAESKGDATFCIVGEQVSSACKQIRVPVNKPLRVALEIGGVQMVNLSAAQNLLKLDTEAEDLALELLLSVA